MPEFLSGLPEWLKYVFVSWIPTIELRAAIPWAVAAGEQVYLPIIYLASLAIFWPGYYFLEFVYKRFPQEGWLHRKFEKIRAKAHPLVEKYGFIGLAVFVAVPLPGTGAYAGTAAAWLLDMEPKRAFLAVSLGVTSAFLIVWGLSEAVGFGIRSM
ncbi:MAG: small multi-drug export protein [Coriobacteriia bacterium]|nr:small multi-drug export protein [Coriobacteriia bacterium]MBN2840345.1 small multi-drug export protein [Coriobacteriia bacterium]